MQKLKIKSIAISTHVLADGPAQALEKYLIKNKVENLLLIEHPLYYNNRLKSSGYKVYEDGMLIKKKFNEIRKIPSILAYIKDIFLNIWFILASRHKFDYYIGFNNLNAFSGWFLKKIGKVDRCIYYVVDFTPKRFENKILNYIYHKIESFCAINCDETWNLSYKMIEGREKFKGVEKSLGIQKVVPMGIWFDEKKIVNFNDIDKKQLVFMGNLLEKQGVQFVLESIPYIVKELPSFKFLIIGDGEYKNFLMKKINDLNIEKFVKFAGFVKKHEDIEKMISHSALAVALYEKGNIETNFTYFADPGKIKAYLGAGVPILLTDVPHNAKDIQENRCGRIIDYNPIVIADTIVKLLNSEDILREYRKNATQYIKKFDWNEIFNKEFGVINE